VFKSKHAEIAAWFLTKHQGNFNNFIEVKFENCFVFIMLLLKVAFFAFELSYLNFAVTLFQVFLN